MKYYITENRVLPPFSVDLSETNIVSKDINDTFDELMKLPKYIEISEAQYQFHLDNPTASMQEVWNMELTPIPIQTNADIEQLRQQAYLNESNAIMFAFRQYEMLGETVKAEAKRIEWMAKVEEIRERYPYIK